MSCPEELCYLDARVYGTDEEDVGENDEDTDVDPQHYWGAAGEKTQEKAVLKELLRFDLKNG